MTERGHILIVDDLRTNRLKLALGLKQQGHRVAEAENGYRALEMLRETSFDLILLDILMPGMNGYEVLAQIKQDEALRDVPVIVISAQDNLESVARGIELGAEDYLPKTFDPVLLRARIAACLEKKRLRDTARESQAAYQNLVENSDQGLVLYQDHKIIKVNQAFARMCGLPLRELYDYDLQALASMIHPDDVQAERARLQQFLSAPASYLRGETRILQPGGQVRWVEFTLIGISFMGKPAIQITAIDRTQHKLAEQALIESEERYRVLAETAQDFIYIINEAGTVKYANQYASNLFGVQPQALVGKHILDLVGDQKENPQLKSLETVFRTGQMTYTESRMIFPVGELWLSTWLVPLKDATGAVQAALGISRNINHLKQLEASLVDANARLEARVAARTAELDAKREQLRQLTHQLVRAQEEERRRVSRELHDEAGQLLIGLKYRLNEALSNLPDEFDDARHRIALALESAGQATQKIRHLSHLLRPPTLDVAGLNLSLKNHCREFSEQTSIPVFYKGVDVLHLPDEASISLYRVLQEGLTNIYKHARAKSVSVALSSSRKQVVLTIADDGIGYDVNTKKPGIGILGMRERLLLLGGELEVSSLPNQGTTLKAIVPGPFQKLRK